MALMTIAEVKTLLQITDTSKDALITALIPIVESEIRDYCNADFTDAPDEPSWESWMKLPAARMIGYNLDASAGNGIKSESQGGYSYTKEDTAGSYPIGIMHAFDKARRQRMPLPTKRGLYRDLRGMTAAQIVTGLEPQGNIDDAITD